jgi:hypothetical protein
VKEARNKGLHEKVKVIDMVKEAYDYMKKNAIEDIQMENDSDLKRFLRLNISKGTPSNLLLPSKVGPVSSRNLI